MPTISTPVFDSVKNRHFRGGSSCATFDFFKKYYNIHCATLYISSKVDSSTVFFALLLNVHFVHSNCLYTSTP